MPGTFPKDIYNLKDENVLITGAAGQLGSMLVDAILKCGARVAALDVSKKVLEQKAASMQWDSKSVLLLEADIRRKEDIKSAFNSAVQEFGWIHHLVNNAGVNVFEPYQERTEESLDWVMGVNLKGTFFCIQEFLRLKEQDMDARGSIVNIASLYGVISPDPRIYTDCDRKNSEIYGATKAGVIQMTKYFSVHAASCGVRINGVSPGGIRNPENPQGENFQKNYSFRCPLGRMAETWEILGPVVFLLSPAANYITGQNIVVDGGMSSW